MAEIDEGQRFAVNPARTGIRLDVPAGVPLPESLEKAGKRPRPVPEGICSLPENRGLQQRNPYLTDQQTAANTIMMCCVHAAETKNWSWTFEYHH
ncbi:hypothetical protein [[Micrococcus luteus] ATCC 49442]|uniref:hypothetical protein n=1 Tax=[Micrococcus luteus] ATCC 49442 TaxID=2698727 RepID=UPI0013D93191|nr:hypothetical protein [[Micrococcus luteus] ATCC 49442]